MNRGHKKENNNEGGRITRTLAPVEKETIIIFNKGEKEATVFTYEKTWQRHLETRFHLTPISDNGYGGKEYIVDKHRIKMPRAPFTRKKKAEINTK